MKSGAELGEALGQAIKLKKVSQREVAEEFKIKQPSVSNWIKTGRIDKEHLVHVFEYFEDVVTPEHWGLPPGWTTDAKERETLPADIFEMARGLARIRDENARELILAAAMAQIEREVRREEGRQSPSSGTTQKRGQRP